MKRPGRMLRQVIDSIFRKTATTSYPYVKAVPLPNFRGKLRFIKERCIGCRLCMKDCPADAITVRKVGEKQFEMDIDLGKCIFCAQCVDSCPKGALEATPEFELARIKRGELKVTLDAGPQDSTAETSEKTPDEAHKRK